MRSPFQPFRALRARPGVPVVTGIGAILLVGCVANSATLSHAEEPRDGGPAILPMLLVAGTISCGAIPAVAIPTDRDLWLLVGLMLLSAVTALFFLASHRRHVAEQRNRRVIGPPDDRRRPEA